MGSQFNLTRLLGLAPQALCFRLLRRLRAFLCMLVVVVLVGFFRVPKCEPECDGDTVGLTERTLIIARLLLHAHLVVGDGFVGAGGGETAEGYMILTCGYELGRELQNNHS